MDLTWYGHSTWKVEVGTTTLLIDPNFDNPHAPVEASELETPDCLLLTHGHVDHVADVPAFAESTVIATPEVATFVAEEYGATDSVFNFGMNVGGTVRAGDAYVTMHGAAHTNELGTDYGDRSYSASGGIPVSYTISDENPSRGSADDATTFYHAGDTALTVEMREIIGNHYAPDAAAVPIGGSFTMGPKQAAIAVEWLDVAHAFPMHYDTSPPIEQDPELFARRVARTDSDATVHELDGGETVSL